MRPGRRSYTHILNPCGRNSAETCDYIVDFEMVASVSIDPAVVDEDLLSLVEAVTQRDAVTSCVDY